MSEAERTIVVGVDYSDQSVVAVDDALRAAATVRGTRLVPVLVLPASTTVGAPDSAEMLTELIDRSSENLVQLIEGRAKALRLTMPAVQPQVHLGAPAEALLNVAREVGAELIAVGTHGRRGLSHLLLGSVAEEVMRKASCSVLIARSRLPSAAEQRAVEASPVARTDARVQAPSPPAEPSILGGAGDVGSEAGIEDAEPTVVAGPHIDAGRVVLHVLDAPSGQVFVCAFESEEGVSVEPLEGSWVPAPSSAARARVARIARRALDKDRRLFTALLAEIERNRRHDANR
jgi:nucleotide-binding universal stress UspA family protein